MSCLECSRFEPVTLPALVSLTADDLEGLHNELSFTQSKLVEAEEIIAEQELLRRSSAKRSTKLTKDNFDLMRQNAVLEQRLKCFGGSHVGNEERCLACKRLVDEDSWRTRKAVEVSLESFPPGMVIGPYVLLDLVERAQLLARLEEADALVEENRASEVGETDMEELKAQLRSVRNRLRESDDLLLEYHLGIEPLVTEYELNADENANNPQWVNAYYLSGEYFTEDAKATNFKHGTREQLDPRRPETYGHPEVMTHDPSHSGSDSPHSHAADDDMAIATKYVYTEHAYDSEDAAEETPAERWDRLVQYGEEPDD